jgi:hypothetical protein
MGWTAGYRLPASSGRPIVAIAGRPAFSGDLSGLAATTRAAGFHAIDLDLTRTLVPPRWRQSQVDEDWAGLRVRSCWLPATLSGPFARRRAAALLAFLRRGRDEAGLRTVVLPRSASGRGVPLAATVRELTTGDNGSPLRLAVAVDAATLAASRSQRSALQSIRRMAEEWELEIALDLTVPTNSAWEAEAAVLRLLPRLRLVRLPCRTESDIDAGARTVERTVAMLADQGFAGTFSLLPPPAPLMRAHPTRDAEHALRSYQEIIARYERIERDLAADPHLGHLPGSSEPR